MNIVSQGLLLAAIASLVRPTRVTTARPGEDHRWWDPADEDEYYWPSEVSRLLSLRSLMAAFETRGYKACAEANPEPDTEKLALYADERGSPTHVARQLPSAVTV